MTNRERYEAVYNFRQPDYYPVPRFEFWNETLQRWYREGLPEGEDPNNFLNLTFQWVSGFDVHMGPQPLFDVQLIEKGERYVMLRDECGVTKRMLRSDFDVTDGFLQKAGETSSMAEWISHPITCYADWEKLRDERFLPMLEGRISDSLLKNAGLIHEQAKTEIISLYNFPFLGTFGTLRQYIGIMNLSIMLYEEPETVKKIANELTAFFVEMLHKIAQHFPVDRIMFFEDMCSTNAPILSPAMFQEFFSPCYRAMIAALKQEGAFSFAVDSDGDCRKLISGWLADGITEIWPCQASAGMDAARLREAYPTLRIHGGINKVVLASDKQSIQAEVKRCLLTAKQYGGYFPWIDHLVPPDVSWDNIRYYVEFYQKYGAG